jgi:TRAP-type transport system periplasmic protein
LTDIAWMFHGYWANKTSLANVISLPLLPFTDAKQASGILWQLYQKYPSLREQFKENHVLLTWASTPYFLVTSQKQVKTLDDIKGLKVRIPTGPPAEIMQALGAIPVTAGMPDIYQYLQMGIIDGMATSWESLLSFKHYELVKYYTYIPMFSVYFSQAMSQDSWNKLPQGIQNQINSVSGLEGSLFWGENMFDSAAVAGRDLVQARSIDMVEYTIPADELARWDEIARPIWEDWIKKQNEAGYPEAREILNTTLELIRSYHP